MAVERYPEEEIATMVRVMVDFERRCEEVLQLLHAYRSQPTYAGRDEVSSAYALLKADLKQAAKFGTLDGKKRAQTRAEQCFYDPAVRRAAIELRPATNSHPLNSHWSGAVLEAKGEFMYYLHNLASATGQSYEQLQSG